MFNFICFLLNILFIFVMQNLLQKRRSYLWRVETLLSFFLFLSHIFRKKTWFAAFSGKITFSIRFCVNGFIDWAASFITATGGQATWNQKDREKKEVFKSLFHVRVLIFLKKRATNVNITEIFRRNNKNRPIDLIRRENA